MSDTLLYQRAGGCKLIEAFEDERWLLKLQSPSKNLILEEYCLQSITAVKPQNLWMGMDPDEILAEGRDILGEKLLAKGEPDYREVSSLLPPLRKNAYAFLSGRISWSGVLVDGMGQIIPQSHGGLRQPDPIFSPVQVDEVLGEKEPFQTLLDRQYPLLFSVHRDGEQVLEFLYFVEAGDPDRDPIVWIRSKSYRLNSPEDYRLQYRTAMLSRPTGRCIEASLFCEALLDTIRHWVNFCGEGAQLQLPDEKLQKVVYGTMMACATTFSGDHPHYGHKHYGNELHDHFPPNYIWALEACCLMGQKAWAGRMLQHMLLYSLNDEGRFVYRQGAHELFGASAEEYGQLLFLLERYKDLLEINRLSIANKNKLKGMGDILLSNCCPCKEADGRLLIVMCAEADTNERVHAYLSNNLWAVRGLQSLGRMLEEDGQTQTAKVYKEKAALLLDNVRALLPTEKGGADWDNLPPFRVGYTALPYTLSSCRDTAVPLTQAELRAYLEPSDYRADTDRVQDLTENTYANYRYYLEMLSAMLLPDHCADAIVSLRETLGGEYLGMTRFYGWVDDWPVTHYARYLLESGRIHKYLLLLYAHTAHHGDPELMCYYEQVTTDGAVIAPDCVPSLLTTAIMMAWMFAYETVEAKQLWLLSALPASWLEEDFTAEGLGFSGGTCSIGHHRKGTLHTFTVTFSKPTTQPVCLFVNHRQGPDSSRITEGMERIDTVDGNRIWIKPDTTQLVLTIAL